MLALKPIQVKQKEKNESYGIAFRYRESKRSRHLVHHPVQSSIILWASLFDLNSRWDSGWGAKGRRRRLRRKIPPRAFSRLKIARRQKELQCPYASYWLLNKAALPPWRTIFYFLLLFIKNRIFNKIILLNFFFVDGCERFF